MSVPVAASWALRDALAGKRGLGLVLAALIPAIFLVVLRLTIGAPSPSDQVDGTATVLTTILLPILVGLIAIVAGGSVLRRPLEESTLIYQLIRPQRRFLLGVVRATSIAVAVAAVSVLSALAVGVLLGQWDQVLGALGALAVGGFTFGAVYGLFVSLHRYAVGLAVAHLVAETALARVGFRVNEYTLTWHLWGDMGEAATVAQRIGAIPASDGTVLLPLFVGVVAVLLVGLVFQHKAFGLGVAEE